MKASLPLLFLCWTGSLFADPLFVVAGGVSPDKQLAVAVVPQKEGRSVDESDSTVYLIDNKTQKPIGPLEEVDAGGGTWGNTTSNVSANWCPDGRFLAVTMRTGRLMHDFVLYRISHRRAYAQKLPGSESNQKGKIYAQLTTSANPGEGVNRWLSSVEFTVIEYGLRPRDVDKGVEAERFGLAGFDDALEKFYVFQKGRWILKDIQVPKDR